MAYRIPRGYDVTRLGFWNIKPTSVYTHALDLAGSVPANFLPIILERKDLEIPVVMYPGTIVGVLDNSTHSAVPAACRHTPGVLAPASAATRKMVYSAYDIAATGFGVATVDLDTGTAVTATGATAASLAVVRPLGIVEEPLFSTPYQGGYENLKYQGKVSILSRGRIIRVPCITAEEKLITVGKLVMVSDTAGDYDPVGSPQTAYPGRYKLWDETTVGHIPYIVGRCVGRHKITSVAGASEHDLLLTHIGTNYATVVAGLNTWQEYDMLAKVQTTPGLSLQGSGTGGVPSALTFARADGSGDFWAIDIAIGVLGI